MKKKIQNIVGGAALPRFIIALFIVLLLLIMLVRGMDVPSYLSAVITRVGMNGVLVLAMVPSILAGAGVNFGLPLGVICGLIGGVISMELGLTGFACFMMSILFSLPFSLLLGGGYGKLLNKVKGSEGMIATYVGFSSVAFMCIVWLAMPIRSEDLLWPKGSGLRNNVALDTKFGDILNNFLSFRIGESFVFPTGLILFFLTACFLMWIFLRSRSGIRMKAAGSNPAYARALGIDVDRNRILGMILSTTIGAVGIIVYAQSYGFFQYYQAPKMMAFPAIAAVLIGGASNRKVSVSNVVIGTILYQGLLTLSLPVANELLPGSNLSEIVRIVVGNGVIIYALTQEGSKR